MIQKQKLRAAQYIRMSTSSQDASPEQQQQQLAILAEQAGYDVTHTFEDLSLSGTKVRRRTGFRNMLKAAIAAEFDVILVLSLIHI